MILMSLSGQRGLATDIVLICYTFVMKSPDYIAHGTSSEKDAKKINEEGFEAKEGRATVSCDLIYAFEWSTNVEKREGSQSKSTIEDGETGRIVIMKVPEDQKVDYSTQTEIEINDEAKEITGYSAKYVSGRKQLGIYASETDEKVFRENREKMTRLLTEQKEFLENMAINPKDIRTKEDLLERIKDFDINQKVEILKKVGEFEKRRAELPTVTEPSIKMGDDSILMSIVPTPGLGKKLGELQQKIKNLEKIDLESFTEEISKIIEDNKENVVVSGVDIRAVIRTMLGTTLETEIITFVRSLSMDVKRAQGFKVYNRGKDEIREKVIDREALEGKLQSIQTKVTDKNFDLGRENLNRYLKINIDKILKELNGEFSDES